MQRHHPEFAAMAEYGREVDLVPVCRRLLGDTLTPLAAYCALQPCASAFLFESVVGGARVGRYSFVGANPFRQFTARGKHVTVSDSTGTRTWNAEDPLEELQKELSGLKAAHPAWLPRFVGGAVGYAAYDSVRYAENLPNAPHDDRKLPDLMFGFYDQMVVFDHVSKIVYVVCFARTAAADSQAEYNSACARVDALVERLQKPGVPQPIPDIDTTGSATLPLVSNFTQPEFEAAVDKCKEFIAAGDIFQVVLSQRFEHTTTAAPLEIYRALRVVNPSPFMFLLQQPGLDLIGASPEVMVRVDRGEVTIRPLAGTRRRGATAAEDDALEAELLADPKERAEHIMLVDLARNDLGRVCEYGSIKLDDVMQVERYSHVMHITTNACGTLRRGLTSLDALRSGLPAGTVSGAPKVRAMEIIDQLEPHRRGPYGGAVGYIDFSGEMDTCIALRTLVLIGNKAYIQCGAGLVADSVPSSEYQETVNKAKGLLKAIEVAERQLKPQSAGVNRQS